MRKVIGQAGRVGADSLNTRGSVGATESQRRSSILQRPDRTETIESAL